MTERLLQMCTGLVTSLAVPCASAAPVKVAEGAGAAYYVVSESVRDARPLRSVAVIHDYAQPEPGGVRSRRVVYDVECSGERLRSVAATEHPGPMGEGSRSTPGKASRNGCTSRRQREPTSPGGRTTARSCGSSAPASGAAGAVTRRERPTPARSHSAPT